MKLITFISFLLLSGASLCAQSPLNWAIDEINPNEDITLYADQSVFTDGLRSCHLQLNSGAVPYLISTPYSVSPGAAYHFSIDVLDNDTAGQLKIFADFYDSYGFNIFGHSPLFSSDSSDWQTISWSDTVPDQAVTGYVLIKFYCEPDLYHFTKPAQAWIDDVQFRQAEGNNLVLNGSFEEWIVGVEDHQGDKNHLAVYPNPASDFVNIDLPDDADGLVISDLMGRELIKISSFMNEDHRVEISMLPEGLYMMSAILNKDRIYQGKLMISRR